MINVMRIVSKIKPMMGKLLKSNDWLIMYDDNTIIDTLTRLFVIRIVANKCSGFCNRSLIFSSRGLFSFSIFSKSLGESEKKATSDADTNADIARHTNVISSAIKVLILNGCTMPFNVKEVRSKLVKISLNNIRGKPYFNKVQIYRKKLT